MKRSKRVYEPYGGNPNIVVKWELPFGKDLIVPGDKIRFKNDRDIYIFQRVCSHLKTENVWIDCLSEKNKSYNSLSIDKLKSVIRPKRSYKKKRVG